MQRKSKRHARRTGIYVVASILALFTCNFATAQTTSLDPPFPRLAAGQIGGWEKYDETRIRNIAKHDVAVLGLWREWSGGGYTVTTLPAHIKSLNPNIKLANYTIVHEVNPNYFPAIHKKITGEKGANGTGDWYLRDANGNHTSSWPETYRINHSSLVTPDANGQRFPQWFARDWYNTLANGAWDAVYSDAQTVDTLVTAAWDGRTNLGQTDPQAVALHAQGHIAYHDAWASIKSDWMFFANMGDQADPSRSVPSGYQGLNEGGWFEGIMGLSWSPETWGGWNAMMNWYRKGMSLLKAPRIGMFHNITSNALGINEYRWNRYGLASCLMDDGYYMVTVDDGYAEQRWYDEFDVDLGHAIDPPQTQAWSNGVYKREFQNGLVLVNPRGNGTKTVNVGQGWKRFSGQQDPSHNNGQPVTSLTLNDADGIILVRTSALIQPKPPALLSVQ